MNEAKQVKKLAASLKRSLKARPELFPYLADSYLKLGREKDAEKLLLRGLTKYPGSVAGWLVQGNLYLKREEHRKARESLEEALKLDADIPFAHEQCAAIAAQTNDQPGQVRHLEELRRLAPLDDNAQSVLYTMLLRQMAVEKGLYTRDEVERVIPGVLRQTLAQYNLLPQELERRADRPSVQIAAGDLGEDLIVVDAPRANEESPSLERPATEIHLSPGQLPKPIKSSQSSPVSKRLGEEAAGQRFQPVGLGNRPTRVNWAETTTPGSPAIVEATPATPDWMGDLAPSDRGILVPPDAGAPNAVTTAAIPPSDNTPRESPIMRLLRGEMKERPVSRELIFTGAPTATPGTHRKPQQIEMESARDPITPESAHPESSPLSHTPIVPPEPVAPTAAPAIQAPPAELHVEPTPVSVLAHPVESLKPVEEIAQVSAPPEVPPRKELAAVAREVTGTAESKPLAAAAPPKAAPDKIATKTLAELYASQGDWKRAVEVYDQLLLKHPTNVAYQQRLQELNKKIEASRKG